MSSYEDSIEFYKSKLDRSISIENEEIDASDSDSDDGVIDMYGLSYLPDNIVGDIRMKANLKNTKSLISKYLDSRDPPDYVDVPLPYGRNNLEHIIKARQTLIRRINMAKAPDEKQIEPEDPFSVYAQLFNRPELKNSEKDIPADSSSGGNTRLVDDLNALTNGNASDAFKSMGDIAFGRATDIRIINQDEWYDFSAKEKWEYLESLGLTFPDRDSNKLEPAYAFLKKLQKSGFFKDADSKDRFTSFGQRLFGFDSENEAMGFLSGLVEMPFVDRLRELRDMPGSVSRDGQVLDLLKNQFPSVVTALASNSITEESLIATAFRYFTSVGL